MRALLTPLLTPLLSLAIVATLSLPHLAQARDSRGGPRLQSQEQPVKRAPNGPQRFERQRPDQGERKPPGRLTQEERRDLHRDLDRANREIYRR
jgi:hypothetical protein